MHLSLVFGKIKVILVPLLRNSTTEQPFIKVLTWPSQNPDLNVIENAWEVLKRKVRLAKPKNLNELWSVVEREWANLSVDYCANLTRNYCQNRLGEVIKAKGYSIDY